ncbi:arylacetamide deacetylase-like 4 [Rana temporaria]|uniref:arylacetamide deacetylase-like 4 n=1 Tax=Rana temporaria TaxID=8407 RepID=UPI001AAD66A7|nr:arylacetamide deacetylase-like 4 [Rana temporaria]
MFSLLSIFGVFLLLCTLLLFGAVYVESRKAEYPPGIACSAELRSLYRILSFMSVLGRTLEKLGICTEIGLSHLLERLGQKRSEDDPELFMKDLEFEGVPVRVYQPRDPSPGNRKGVLFFHGGGFIHGNLDQYDKLCGHISKRAGVVLVSVGYRLAPEHLYPAAFQDCLTASIHFLRTALDFGVNPSSVITCGDSAGGNLAAAVSQALVTRKDIPRPLAQVMIYPVLQMIDFNLPSYQQNRAVPLLLRDRALFYLLTYVGRGDLSVSRDVLNGSHVPPDVRKKFSKWLSVDHIPEEVAGYMRHTGYTPHTMAAFDKNLYEKLKQVLEPSFSPLVADDAVLRLLPKSYLLTCEFDVLRDEGILYKKRLEDNGVSVTWHHIKDGFHGLLSFYDQWACESGIRAMDSIVGFIKDA